MLRPPCLQVFGNAAFRSQQRQVIEAAMRGQDCFVLMPTGGGWGQAAAGAVQSANLLPLACDVCCHCCQPAPAAPALPKCVW